MRPWKQLLPQAEYSLNMLCVALDDPSKSAHETSIVNITLMPNHGHQLDAKYLYSNICNHGHHMVQGELVRGTPD